jgi:hypothetical protein
MHIPLRPWLVFWWLPVIRENLTRKPLILGENALCGFCLFDEVGESSRDSSPEMSLGSRVSRSIVKVLFSEELENHFINNGATLSSNIVIIAFEGRINFVEDIINLLRFCCAEPVAFEVNSSVLLLTKL